jgi:hypothetical protein
MRGRFEKRSRHRRIQARQLLLDFGNDVILFASWWEPDSIGPDLFVINAGSITFVLMRRERYEVG